MPLCRNAFARTGDVGVKSVEMDRSRSTVHRRTASKAGLRLRPSASAIRPVATALRRNFNACTAIAGHEPGAEQEPATIGLSSHHETLV
jgi:hypothetical protein